MKNLIPSVFEIIPFSHSAPTGHFSQLSFLKLLNNFDGHIIQLKLHIGLIITKN